ncbi:uncharacterized protein F4812DRAFT_7635 [Daldinia caldariorum]|uniref:uncharacterized protein n=1 Tax=Daldinia caldariorum TaxID=326644 RepID=UPI0020083952|nr:uncharacterized protein F4812DRAFT_7635 [Daldinia caldariorum]KAI1472297.1 hypothetical protein F4812DRAFT_7635 [Daldinia caldariorum]
MSGQFDVRRHSFSCPFFPILIPSPLPPLFLFFVSILFSRRGLPHRYLSIFYLILNLHEESKPTWVASYFNCESGTFETGEEEDDVIRRVNSTWLTTCIVLLTIFYTARMEVDIERQTDKEGEGEGEKACVLFFFFFFFFPDIIPYAPI